VSCRRPIAWDLFLLLHAASLPPAFATTQSIEQLRRFLRVRDDHPRAGRVVVKRNLSWLAETGLTDVAIHDNDARVRLLDEGAPGKAYRLPEGKDEHDSYLRMPTVYWSGGWFLTLDLPAKFVLLVSHSLRAQNFLLPIEKADTWYGVSTATLQRGLASLRRHEVLRTRGIRKPAPNSPLEYRYERRHTLIGDFARATTPGAA
jgi:hypothetical protein